MLRRLLVVTLIAVSLLAGSFLLGETAFSAASPQLLTQAGGPIPPPPPPPMPGVYYA